MYDKANSLGELRVRARADDGGMLRRIERVAADLVDGDARAPVLRRACAALLDEPTGVEAEPTFYLRDHVRAELARLDDEELPRYLFYRYRYDVFPVTHEVDAFPPCLQIEPTSICNYRCVFCYQTDPALTLPANGLMGMMSIDTFKRVIDQAEGRCEAVTLASRGEPLMCRGIEEMLAYMGDKFLAAKMNTNAWFLDERKAHAILASGLGTLVISADAASEPEYSQLRVNGRLDRVLDNVRRFVEIRRTQYPTSRLITRVSGVRVNATQDLEAMERVWGDLADQVAFVDYLPWENTYERAASGIAAPCSDLWRRMFVWHDGGVNPCDVDYRSTLKVGSAQESSLSSVWTGPLYQRYRDTHLSSNRATMSPCSRCEFI